MKTEIVQMSPKKATELLKSNRRNRPLSPHLVKELMTYINNDQWKLTHQGVCVSMTGSLLDGQHRLTAISKGSKTVPIMVTYGLPDEIMTVIDIGKKRTIGDSFALLEVKNHNVIAAVIAKYFRVKNNLFTEGNQRDSGEILSIDQRYEFYLQNSTVIDKCIALANKCYNKARFYVHSEVAAMSLYLILDQGNSFARVSDFWLQVHMFDGYTQCPATKTLSNVLLKYVTGSEKMKPRYKTAITIKAWNFYKNSGQVKVLKFAETESFPAFV